jgi:hypothetical protein
MAFSGLYGSKMASRVGPLMTMPAKRGNSSPRDLKTASGRSLCGRRLGANQGRDKTNRSSTAIGRVNARLFLWNFARFWARRGGSALSAGPATSYLTSAAAVRVKMAAKPIKAGRLEIRFTLMQLHADFYISVPQAASPQPQHSRSRNIVV